MKKVENDRLPANMEYLLHSVCKLQYCNNSPENCSHTEEQQDLHQDVAAITKYLSFKGNACT